MKPTIGQNITIFASVFAVSLPKAFLSLGTTFTGSGSGVVSLGLFGGTIECISQDTCIFLYKIGPVGGVHLHMATQTFLSMHAFI